MDDLDRIRIGYMLPDFTLKDNFDKEIKLTDYWGKKNLLVFFLDDIFCKECGKFLSGLQNKFSEITQMDTVLLVISPEHPRFSAKLKQKINLEFPILYDQNSVVTKLYGLLNSNSAKGAPHPTVFVADKDRVIRYKKVNLNHGSNLSVDEIIESLKKL